MLNICSDYGNELGINVDLMQLSHVCLRLVEMKKSIYLIYELTAMIFDG